MKSLLLFLGLLSIGLFASCGGEAEAECCSDTGECCQDHDHGDEGATSE